MADQRDLFSYFAERSITPAEIDKFGIRFVEAQAAADILGLQYVPKTKSNMTPNVAAIMPGQDGYNHCVFAAGGKQGFVDNPVEFVKRTTSKRVAPNDIVLLPGHNWAFPPEVALIAESYIKGIVLHRLGHPVIVLNGVSGYGSHPGIVARLLHLPWGRGRARVVLCFDSINTVNADSARNVRHAKTTMAGILHHHYEAETLDLDLPSPPTELNLEDWGVDDYFVANGLESLQVLLEQAQVIDVDTRRAAVEDYNTRFSLITEMGKVATLRAPFRFMNREHFGLVYGNEWVTFPARNRQGQAVELRQPVPKTWLEDHRRLTLDRVVFRPGEDTIKEGTLNIWEGLAVKPDYTGVKEAEKYFVELVHEALKDCAEWFLDAMASLVQHPERRTGWYLYLMGEKGTGKGYIAGTIKAIFGGDHSHAPSLTLDNYCNKFNSSKYAARLLFIDEIPSSVPKEVAATFEAELKLDADPNALSRPVEPKGRDIVYIDRNCTVFISSNFMPAWDIEWGDRRAACLHFRDEMCALDDARPWGTKNSDWWAERFAWRDHQGGPSKVLAYLMARDISAFRTEEAPPVSQLKKQIMGFNAGDFRGFLQAIRVDPTVLEVHGENISRFRYMTTEQLAHVYHQGDDVKIDKALIAKYGRSLHQLQFQSKVFKIGPKGGQREVRSWKLHGPEEVSGSKIMAEYVEPLNGVLARLNSVAGRAKFT